MRKLISIMAILVLFLGMSACGSSSSVDKPGMFVTQADMFDRLNGIWVADNEDQSNYYIFQNGNVYYIDRDAFKYRIECFMDNTLETNGLDALCQLDYKTVLNTLTPQALLGDPYSDADIEIDHKDGKIVLNKDTSDEQHIVVHEDSIDIQDSDGTHFSALKKLSDNVDFTGECFETIFSNIKENYQIPSSQFWTDTKEYGEMVKTYNPEIAGWEIVTNTEEKQVYQSSKWVSSVSGVLVITDQEVTYSNKVSVMNNWNPSFMVMYTPYNNELIISDIDNLSLNFPLLFQYANNAVRNFPGAYKNHLDLYDALASEEGVTQSGAVTVEKTINGITYKVQIGTSGDWAILTIKANDSVSLSSVIGQSSTPDKIPTCPQCGKSEPDTTFYDDWKPGDVCFSCGYDNFHGGEDAKKYCSQCGTDCTYRGLEEDGRCEDCHASDNTPSQPHETQPPETQPPETQPSETQPPAVCSHNYADATCTAPKTCTKCGATTGSAVGHTWKNATCTEPATCSTCHETWGSAKGHSWQEATCAAPKTCQTCKATEGSALPHSMYGTKCLNCDYTDFSEYALTSNTFCLDSWFYLGDGSGSQYLEDGEASINIDSKGVCKVSFDKYSYTFTLKQTDFGSEPVFECYMNGEPVKTARVTFYYSQNRCDFFLYGGALGFSQVALNFDM